MLSVARIGRRGFLRSAEKRGKSSTKALLICRERLFGVWIRTLSGAGRNCCKANKTDQRL